MFITADARHHQRDAADGAEQHPQDVGDVVLGLHGGFLVLDLEVALPMAADEQGVDCALRRVDLVGLGDQHTHGVQAFLVEQPDRAGPQGNEESVGVPVTADRVRRALQNTDHLEGRAVEEDVFADRVALLPEQDARENSTEDHHGFVVAVL